MKIRPYATKDEQACRACMVELQDYERQIEPRLRPGEAIADEYMKAIHERCRQYDGHILVADIDGEVAGLAVVFARVPFEELDEPTGDYALVAELVVRDRYRRQGIGGALLQASEQCAREAGATELRIGVLSGNEGARRLYRLKGFAPHLESLVKRLA